MNKYVFTEIWNDFQIRSDTEDRYDLVKWHYFEPREVIDGITGERKIITQACYSIGFLTWNEDELWFDFESVGTRYLEDRIDGLEEWIIQFCKRIYKEKTGNEYGEFNL